MNVREEIGRRADELTADLLRFANTLVRDRALAADLVQDTFVRALAAADGFRGDSTLRTWLHTILYRLAVDRARRSERELVVEDVEQHWQADDYTIDPATIALNLSDRAELEDALARLPFHYRSTVVLHDMVGWTVAEIAAAMDLGLPAAKQRLRRGRMLLTSAMAAGAERRRALEGVPMRCWDARLLVSDYLDGDLDAESRHAVEAHLQQCPTCPPLYASLVGVHEALGAMRDGDVVVPPELARRIASIVEDDPPT
jgi:RNA polymerase sigma-70 factor, ECF subfamily